MATLWYCALKFLCRCPAPAGSGCRVGGPAGSGLRGGFTASGRWLDVKLAWLQRLLGVKLTWLQRLLDVRLTWRLDAGVGMQLAVVAGCGSWL